jgi:hypothetical protein
VKKFYSVIFLATCFSHVFATHNLGGDISYRCISGTTYEITVNTYTDVNTPATRCELEIVFGDGSPADSLVCVNGPSVICAPYGDGILIGQSNNVRYGIYKVTHTYPGPGTYHITMTDPNRHNSILNMANSVNTSFGVEAVIIVNPLFGAGNNSCAPDNPVDLDTAYTSLFHQFNAHASDTDGDSLVYQLMVPMYAASYTLPATSFYFGCDTISGIIDWLDPNAIGYYSFAVRIYEYRLINSQYYLVGYTTRDIFSAVFPWSGIHENELELQVNVFPNPSSSDVTISGAGLNSKMEVKVMDAAGKRVKAEVNFVTDHFIISRKGLLPGCYFFVFTGEGNKVQGGKFEIIE